MRKILKLRVFVVVFGVFALSLSLFSAHLHTDANAVGPRGVALTPYLYLPIVVKETQPSPTATPIQPGWLSRTNLYRDMANIPAVSENTTWSDGDWKHARYVVKNDIVQHTEDSGNEWYTPEGAAAGQASNVLGASFGASDQFAIDRWMQAPFHAVGIIDPALAQVGFGSYSASDGGIQMAAAMNVITGRGPVPASVVFPVKWPDNGKTSPLGSFGGSEYPNPLANCPGYAAPSGLPIILQLGPGNVVPSVTSHSFSQSGSPLEHCLYDQTSYTNPNPSDQSLARSILAARSAIVLMPRAPLTPGTSYTVSITTNGQTYSWSFAVSSSAPAASVQPGVAMP